MGAFIYGYINDTKEHRVKDYNGAFNYCRNKNADLYITFNLAIFSYHKKEDAVGPHDPGYAAAVNKVLTPHNNAHFVYICDGDFYGQPTKP